LRTIVQGEEKFSGRNISSLGQVNPHQNVFEPDSKGIPGPISSYTLMNHCLSVAKQAFSLFIFSLKWLDNMCQCNSQNMSIKYYG
jgi:hypothetical protein